MIFPDFRYTVNDLVNCSVKTTWNDEKLVSSQAGRRKSQGVHVQYYVHWYLLDIRVGIRILGNLGERQPQNLLLNFYSCSTFRARLSNRNGQTYTMYVQDLFLKTLSADPSLLDWASRNNF